MTPSDIHIERQPSRYTPESIGIVHLGLGAFHRAHQAVYLQAFSNRSGGEPGADWGITSANIRSNRTLVDQLHESGHRYHVAEFSDSRHVTLREIRVIREALYAGPDGPDRETLLSRMSETNVRIITLTVTEKGYFLNPASGELLSDAPPIAHDLIEPHAPHTAPGMLVEALARRRDAGTPAFTVLCCDNMPNNGQRTRGAVVALARHRDPALAEWIAQHVAFPSSMVDRIVPAMTDADRERLAQIGVDDPAAVIGESFRQWVIEDDFPLGRPAWEADGVEMVADVAPFETMKLRLLNGAHSLLAYAGTLAGFETVDAAIARPAFRALLRDYWQREAEPTLALPATIDVLAYTEQLLARFANDSLHHRLIQIAMDGSQKLPQRWLAGAEARLATGEEPVFTAFGVAVWIRFTRGTGLAGTLHTVDDPMAETFSELHRRHGEDSSALVVAFLALDDIFPAALSRDARFAARIVSCLESLESVGVEATIVALAHTDTDTDSYSH